MKKAILVTLLVLISCESELASETKVTKTSHVALSSSSNSVSPYITFTNSVSENQPLIMKIY